MSKFIITGDYCFLNADIGEYNSFSNRVNIDWDNRPSVTVKIGNHGSFGNKIKIAAKTNIGSRCVIGNNVKIGSGCQICDGVIIENNVSLANNCIIGTGTIITANSQIGFSLAHTAEYQDYPTIIGSKCLIESSFIGKAAEVRSGSHISKKCTIGDGAVVETHSFINKEVVPFTVCVSEGMVNINRAMLRKLEWYDDEDKEGFSILGSVVAQACKQSCANSAKMYLEDRANVRSGERKAIKSMIAFFENQIFHNKAFGKKSSVMECLML